MSNEIVVHGTTTPAAAPMERWTGLEMIVSPKEALRRVQELRAFVAEVMVPEEDFGVIPGTKKPTLYQPGAQKLGELYGFSHRFEITEKIERWEEPMLFYYLVRCVLVSRHDGRFICEGIGSCNSKEDKYAWRWVTDRDMPKGVDLSTLKRKETRTQKGPWVQYRMPNEDVASVVNTIMKMACKRAYVHAVVSATRSAGIFTQDVEDLPREVYGEAEKTRSWQGEVEEIEAEIVPNAVQAPDLEKGFAANIAAATDVAYLDATAKGIAAAIPDKNHPVRVRLRALYVSRRAELSKPPSDPGTTAPAQAQPPSDPPPAPADPSKRAADLLAAVKAGADAADALRTLATLDLLDGVKSVFAAEIRTAAEAA